VSEDRQDLRVERALLQAAAEWESFGRGKQRQQEQIDNAKRLSEVARKSAKRTRLFSVALAVLLFGSLGLAWYAKRQQAIAESRQFAAQARQNLDRDPASSLALAIRAVRRFRTEQF
jgi:hypothetical protein